MANISFFETNLDQNTNPLKYTSMWGQPHLRRQIVIQKNVNDKIGLGYFLGNHQCLKKANHCTYRYLLNVPCGLVVRIPAFHAGGPGSIPGVGARNVFLSHLLNLSECRRSPLGLVVPCEQTPKAESL